MSFPAILILEDGSVYEGLGFGIQELSVGEIVFNTSMSGYQEIITDPSYAKQIIAFTHPHIGNTGVNDEDSESENIFASGIVIKDLPNNYRNWRATQSLESFLESKNTIGIAKAQAMKDATMAWFISQNMKKDHTFIHYNGAFHTDRKEGIIENLDGYMKGLNMSNISTVQQDDISKLEDINAKCFFQH